MTIYYQTPIYINVIQPITPQSTMRFGVYSDADASIMTVQCWIYFNIHKENVIEKYNQQLQIVFC